MTLNSAPSEEGDGERDTASMHNPSQSTSDKSPRSACQITASFTSRDLLLVMTFDVNWYFHNCMAALQSFTLDMSVC